MRLIKETIEYCVADENEAKVEMENIRKDAATNGYSIGAMGYTHKEKKLKGEVIDECEILKVVKIFGGIWE